MSNVEVKFRLKEKLEKRQQYYDRQICGGPAALKYFRQTDIQTEATQIFFIYGCWNLHKYLGRGYDKKQELVAST